MKEKAILLLPSQSKKMRRVLLGLLLHLTQHVMAQNMSLAWVASFHGINQEVGKSVVTDMQGNVYTTGYFLGTVDFDPGANVYLLSSAGQQDIFISKLNSNGNFVWAKRIGGIGNDMATSIAIDTFDNIFITGFFRGIVDFNPGFGISYISTYSSGSQDIYVTKLDSAGNFIWAKSFGGNGYSDSLGNVYPAVSVGYGIQTDATGNVYSTGSFLGGIDFDPNVGVHILSAPIVPNIFISKLDANGNFIWAKQIGENKIGDEAYAIAVDSLAYVYTTGVFSDTADFDPGPNVTSLISAAYNQAFICKLDSDGNFMWAKNLGGATLNDQASGLSIAFDDNGNIISSGKFKGVSDFDPGNGVMNLSSNGNFDIYISKLNMLGDYVWSKSIGGTGGDFCYSVTVDKASHIYATGSFKGIVDFDPGIDSVFLSSMSASTQDVFLLKLNSSGDFLWASQIGGVGNDNGNSIYVDLNGALFVTGYYSISSDFDPGPEQNILVASGGTDAFILKLQPFNMILPITIIHFVANEVQAGNLLKWETSNELNSDLFEVQKSKDGMAFNTIGIIECLSPSTQTSSYLFLDHNKHAGKLYYRLKLLDIDNQYQYSQIITIFNVDEAPRAIVYPNPCRGEINIYSSTNLKKGVIKILNQEGKVVSEKKNIEGQSFRMDISNLSDRVYLIELGELSENAIAEGSTISKIKVELRK